MKPNIAFVTGGYSAEAEISYKSALTIEKNVDRDKYSVYKIDITPQGWFYEAGNGKKLTVDRNDFSLTIDGKKLTFDVLFGKLELIVYIFFSYHITVFLIHRY